ncbi:MAG TPA: redoxin family protein [Pyrinomonadaceae bacterium]|jgi:thioredoxin-related protein
MKKFFRKVQFLSNIATIVIAILLCVVTVKLFFPTSPTLSIANPPKANQTASNFNSRSTAVSPPAAQVTPVGKAVPLEGINWKENKKTLVLYISTTCRYCNESSPFYKLLAEKYSSDKNIKLIAVLPQPVDESKEHLKDLGINIGEVYNSQLKSIGVIATPTLLLVNDSGVVLEYWRGKLTSQRESEVLSKLSS